MHGPLNVKFLNRIWKIFESAAYRSRSYTKCNDVSCVNGHKKHKPAHVPFQTQKYDKNINLKCI